MKHKQMSKTTRQTDTHPSGARVEYDDRGGGIILQIELKMASVRHSPLFSRVVPGIDLPPAPSQENERHHAESESKRIVPQDICDGAVIIEQESETEAPQATVKS